MPNPENLKPWKPGQSGNPSGMSKLEAEVMKAAREKGPRSIERLVEHMEQDEDKAASIKASLALLDRGFGKVKQTVEFSRAQRLLEMSDDELMRIAAGADADDEQSAESSDAVH